MAHTCWDRHTTVQLAPWSHNQHASHPGMSQLHNTVTSSNLTQQSPLLEIYCHEAQQAHNPPSSSQHQQPHQHQYCSLLLQQLDALGWHCISQLAPDLSSITLQLHDVHGRLHTADVQLQAGFPMNAPVVCVQLPRPFKLKWLPGHSLLQLVQQLQQALDSYQDLWHQLEDIDCHTQLLDPPHALAHPYSNSSRCIALGNGSSCQLQLSVTSPHALPSVTFHGPSSVVASLQAAWYGTAAQLWDEQRSVRENIEAVLQLQLPAPKPGSKKGCAAVMVGAGGQLGSQGADADAMHDDNSAGDDSDADSGGCGMSNAGSCAICYSLHLSDPSKPDELGEAPSVSCAGTSCGRLFHAMCLAEWLGSLPTSRRVFDTLFGTCPFCNGPIGVSTRASVCS